VAFERRTSRRSTPIRPSGARRAGAAFPSGALRLAPRAVALLLLAVPVVAASGVASPATPSASAAAPLERARRLLLEARRETADEWASLLDASGPSGTSLDTTIARACVRFAARFVDRVPAETTFATLERAVHFEPRIVLDDSLGAVCERIGEMPQSLAVRFLAASTDAGPGLEARPVAARSIVDERNPVTVDVAPITLHRVPVERPPGTGSASGLLELAALVDHEGKVRSVRIVRSLPGLDAAAKDAVRRWSFTPALRGGQPASFWVPVAMRFVASPPSR